MIRERVLGRLPLPLLSTGLFAGLLLGLALLLASSPAQASEIMAPRHHGKAVTVNVSFNAQLPLLDDSKAAIGAAQADLRRSFYRMARQECTVLLEEIAASCSLNNLNVNSHIQNYNNQAPLMLNANSNASYIITLKP